MPDAPNLAEGGDRPVILFDAECVLCSANALFVLKHDGAGHFRLASMQGPAGGAICRRHGVDPQNPASILIVDGDRVRRDSDAVLAIYEALGFPWQLFGLFRLVPAIVRDPVYRWIARHRYRLFGKRESCWVAPREYGSRIL
ncbi:putative DCC family thiol-disulfide oxidoreductase YuxK [Sphingopyxis panaciterrae]|uniref:thiol-disulfide oxidoreductase DCC family protein n=1 Tax=Sphingopyxis panaciterrae TaxID=363841 RepID=UPI001423F0F2|nr:DCC1-like thiol-disulfide oxidoreductase family protein [Sphingopyxis panaciterrae]NIJ38089.1 putative DCC family thiol-disulfide oxidoreductase YuxK [Sphingopyxis panaciterrae]